MKPLVFASQSKYKLALFGNLGLPFTPAAPKFEETIDPALDPAALAQKLALGKACSLAADFPGSVIIGSDQILALDAKIFTKPGSVDKAVDQLRELTGKTHCLHTAFALFDAHSQASLTGVETSRITFHDNLAPEFLRRLVEEERSWDCVGGYKYESKGPLLMKAVETNDASAIIGLPLIAIAAALDRWGYLRGRFSTPE